VQIDRAEALFDIAKRAAAATGQERATLLAQLSDPGRMSLSTQLADLSVGAIPTVIEVADLVGMQFAAVRLHAAIELHHAEQGAYPATLEELVPRYFPTLPTDPRGPGGIVYRVVDDPTQHAGRGFLLYAVGFDGVDDGGNHAPDDAIGKVYGAPGLPGYDYVFNRPRMAEPAKE
jgi:hypothetical protein